jgi:outer membrane protein assembly factor BamB
MAVLVFANPGDIAADASTATTAPAPAVRATDWPVYHHDAGGSGVDTSGVQLSAARSVWTSPVLDGDLFGEPLAVGNTVYVATENDTVYALNGTDGSVIWSTHVASPVPSAELPCGDISPVEGFTGTPVIDTVRSELFAVADEQVHGEPAHMLIGINIANGSVELRQSIDPVGAATPALLQRTALTVTNGNVVFGYGGNYGDCSSYHGWVVSVPEAGGTPTMFEADSASGESQGAVWMGGGAPVIDTSGNIWVAVGNGSVTTNGTYDNSDSVLELSPSLHILQYFAPTDWYTDNGNDRDLGSSVPALMGNGLVVQGGKSQTAFLLRQSDLGGIGGQLTQLKPICGQDFDGGVAFMGGVVYLPCQSGVVALTAGTSPPSLRLLWQTSSGSGGPPIVAGGFVWSISSGGTLFGLDPNSGAPVQQFSLGQEANHFPTPSVGDGLLLAPSADQVHAFEGVATASGTTVPTTTVPAATSAPLHHGTTEEAGGSGDKAGWLWVLLVVGGALVVFAGVILLGRRRAHRRPRTR